MAALVPAMLLLSARPSLAATPIASSVVDIDAPLQGTIAAPADAAIVIGNEDYGTLPDVPFAGRDARAFQGFLQYTRGIPADRIAFVGDATRDAMLGAVARATAKIGKGGTLWVYFVGHGAVDLSINDRVLVGADAADKPKSLSQQSVSLTELANACSGGGHRTILILDSSFQGVGRDGKEVFARWRYKAPPLSAYLPQDLMIWTAVAPDAGRAHARGHAARALHVLRRRRAPRVGRRRRSPAARRDGHARGGAHVGRAMRWAPSACIRRSSVGARRTSGISRAARWRRHRKGSPGPRQRRPSRPSTRESDPETAAALARMAEIRAQATREWTRVARDAAKGGPRARAALQQFLATYERRDGRDRRTDRRRDGRRGRDSTVALRAAGRFGPLIEDSA